MVKINTRPYHNVIEHVAVDDRENDRVEVALEQYSSFHPIVKHLRCGDYIFKGVNEEYVCVEYKKGMDFLTSLSNGHLHNQVYDMIREYDHHFVMVEVENINKLIDKKYYSTGISTSIQEINGAIASLNTVTTVCFNQTQFGAFDFMMRQAGKLLQQKPFTYKHTKKTHNTALNYLSSIHGLSEKARVIVDELKISTLNDLLNLTVEDLLTVQGIGKKTAENIINEIGG